MRNSVTMFAVPKNFATSPAVGGTVVHCGRQLATGEARQVGPDGKLYAHASRTCQVFELR